MAEKHSKTKIRGSLVTDAESIYRHEFGHAVHNQLLSEDDQMAIRWEFLDADAKKLSKQVSKYAASDPEECFAEIFNAMTSGKKTEITEMPETCGIIKRVLGI
jgi:hypothetical protein